MNIVRSLLIVIVVTMLAPQLRADVTINITGSSAFRTVVIKALQTAMPGYTATYTGSALLDGNQQLIKGSFPGIPGTTTIRTSWNGSVEGAIALNSANSVSYIPETASTQFNAGIPYTSYLVPGTPSFSFSDVYQESTGFSDVVYSDTFVGIVAYRWVANEGADLSNMTTQNAKRLFSAGRISKKFFSGNSTDDSKNVYLTGRYDGSGSRANASAEIGYGLFDSVRQYYVETSSVNGTITALRLWPNITQAPTLPNGTQSATTANGGYTSGTGIRDIIGCTMSASISIKNSSGVVTSSDATATLVSYLGVSDAVATQAAGHVDLAYNGVHYSPENVINGAYTFWGVAHLFYRAHLLTPDEITFYNTLTGFENHFPTRGRLSKAINDLGASAPGVRLEDMTVGRSTTDGSLVGPGLYEEPPLYYYY